MLNEVHLLDSGVLINNIDGMLVNSVERVFIRCGGFCPKSFLMLVLFLGYQSTQAQDLWGGSEFIETSDASYQVEILSPTADLKSITVELQPKRKKAKMLENEAILSMTYVVYEHAAIGQRPFGRIRYEINLKKDGNLLTCQFEDFTFKKIERSARYGKLEEVGGRPIAISMAKSQLTKSQWEIVRWKTEVVVKRKISTMSANNLQVAGSQ